MKPLKLTMQAFGSYGKKTTIDFEEPNQNIFLVTGDTGAGKTTIFDAIVFALYGEAGASAGKKDGVLFQSQYADYDIEPYVELSFCEGYGEDQRIYTVRRVPRHLTRMRRGTGKGIRMREINSSVTLILPDGSEYPSKEANRRLEEIVGLTKGQFMQVAMIAQGEFMELLRAKTDDKKVIFRKLFNTGLYQRITEELSERKKAREKEIAVIRTECRTIAAGIKVPADYERADAAAGLKARILDGELAVLGDFLQELRLLCGYLENRYEETDQAYREALLARDQAGEAYTNALHLQGSFVRYEEAKTKLASLNKQKEEIDADLSRIARLKAACEIRGEYRRLNEAKDHFERVQAELAKWQDSLPVLEEEVIKLSAAEKEQQELCDRESDIFSRESERVNRAFELFKEIAEMQKKSEEESAVLAAIQKNSEKKQQEFSVLTGQEEEWKQQAEELKDAETQKTAWEAQYRTVTELVEDASALDRLRRDAGRQKMEAKKAADAYLAARKIYQNKNSEYVGMRQAFLDAGAGYLAQELLPGVPCPVCGSTEHPHPCEIQSSLEAFSRADMDRMEGELKKQQEDQERKAAAAKSAADLLEEKEISAKNGRDKLLVRMKRSFYELPDSLPEENISEYIEAQAEAVRERGNRLSENVRLLQQAREKLQAAEEDKQKLREEMEHLSAQISEARIILEGTQAGLRDKNSSLLYPTRDAARKALETARRKKEDCQAACQAVQKALKASRDEKNRAETLIRKYRQEMPDLQEKLEQQRETYEKLLQKYQMTGSDWKDCVREDPQVQIEILQRKVDAYRNETAAAEALAESAGQEIAGRTRPVMEEYLKRKEEAQESYESSLTAWEETGRIHRENQEAFAELEKKMSARQTVVEEHTKLDTLYRLLSGNVSGSRMDLETFVQRYYLELILDAANRRFLDMTAGQFELRMMSLEKAGDGKNKGLDLMVYSNVTGREREIRTLSGGESFMAALSLALGMADQIQENTAAVNLDIMFIDEGFGSLDDRSRDQAVRVLLEMAEGSKLIGIISHVSELKQQIEDQLYVTKDEAGSHVRWQIS